MASYLFAPNVGQLQMNTTYIHYIIIIVLLRKGDFLKCVHVLNLVLRIKVIESS